MAEYNNSELGRAQFPLAGTQLCPRPARVSRCIVGSTTATVSTPVNSSNVYYSSSDEDKEDGLSMTSTSTTRSGDEDEEEEVEGTTEKIWTLVEQAQEARQGILRDQAERGDEIQRIGRDMAQHARLALEQEQQEKEQATSNLKMCLGILVERLWTSEGERVTLQRKNSYLQAEVARLRDLLAATSTTTVGVSAPAESPVAEETTDATAEVAGSTMTPARGSIGSVASPAMSPSPLVGVTLVKTKCAATDDKDYSPETVATFAKTKSLLAATLAEMKSARSTTGDKGYSPGTVACFARTKSLLTDTFAKMKSIKVAPVDKTGEYSPETKACFARTKFLLTDAFAKMKSGEAATVRKSTSLAGETVKSISPAATTDVTTGTEGTSPAVSDSSNITSPVTTTVAPVSENTSPVGPIATANFTAAPTGTTGTKPKPPIATTGTKTKFPAATAGIAVSKHATSFITGGKSMPSTTTNRSMVTSPAATTGTKTNLSTTTTTTNDKAVSPVASVTTPFRTRRPLGNMNPNSGGMPAAEAQAPSLALRPVVIKPAVNRGSIDMNAPSTAPGVVTGAVENRAVVCSGPARGGAPTGRVVRARGSGDGGKVEGVATSGRVVRSAEAHGARGKVGGSARSGRVLRSDTRATAGAAAAKEIESGLSAGSGSVPADPAALDVPPRSTRTTTRRPSQRTSISTTGRGVQTRGKFMRF